MPLLLAIVIGLLFCHHGYCETREFTDNQGRTLEAQILWKCEEFVLVRRVDGVEFQIPLDILYEKDQSYVAAWIAKTPASPTNPIHAVVAIQNSQGSNIGTGFFAFCSGRTYVYTNQHVISDIRNIRAVDHRGDPVKLGYLEVSNSLDVARFRVQDRDAFRISDDPNPQEEISVIGFSGGMSVATMSKGKVLGIGHTEIEVDSDFIPGNSGGPILNSSNEVLGIATYISLFDNSPEWVTRNTRYAEVRRFTVRPSRVNDWKKVAIDDYARQNNALKNAINRFSECLWAFDLLAKGDNYVSTLPSTWHRDVVQILRNHNSRQRRPDSTRTTEVRDGIIYTVTHSHVSEKEASRRSNLRALDTHLDREFGDLYNLRHRIIDIEYLRSGMFGADYLLHRVNQLKQEISNAIDLSQRRS